ncbi:MAG: HDOD domain-containing protein, partial [Verrucomicrobiota bacterium]
MPDDPAINQRLYPHAAEQMKNRILIIDDELDYIEGYKAVLARKSDQWVIEYSNNPQQSLQSALQSPPDILIADYEMPQLNGIELLKAVEQKRPQVERFIVADPEEKDILDAGIGSSFHFLPKPCSGDFLISEIQRALAIESWLGNKRTKEIVGKMGEFPSLPPMYLKVMNALNSKNASAANIGKAIASDLAISAKIMQVVNSSYFGLDAKVSDITHAVSILGIDTVKNLVLAIQVFGKLGKSKDQLALTDQLWHHSMSVATAAKRIMQYETGDRKLAEEAYTAGLFHDIGKLVMINAVSDEFESARKLARKKGIPLWQAESETIGCTHADTGAYLLGRWGMPVNVVEAASLHHEPVNTFGSTFSHLAAVHAANALTWENHFGSDSNPEAQADERFITEIGRSQSWAAWQEVVTGKREEKEPATPKAASNSSPPAAETNTSSEGTLASTPEGNDLDVSKIAAQEADKALEKVLHRREAKEEPKQNGAKIAIISVCAAACLAVAFYLFSSEQQSRSESPIEDEFAALDSAFDSEVSAEGSSPEFSEAPARQDAPAEKENVDAKSETTPIPIPDEESITAKPNPSTAAEERIETPSEASTDNPKDAIASNEPFPKPIIKKANNFPEINLTGIFYNPSNPAASVNGK